MIWKDIPGYEGYYQVSDDGQVCSLDRVDSNGRRWRGQIKSQSTDRGGYQCVRLSKDNKQETRTVHSLVAEAYIGPYPEGQQVRHGPNGKQDNSVSNLCYGTRSDDELDKRRDGISNARPVRRSDGVEFDSIPEAAESLGKSHTAISNVCNGYQKTAGGFAWEYV